MNAIGKTLLIFLYVCLTEVHAASLDDVINYSQNDPQPPAGPVPYTVDEIINLLPEYIDSRGVYNGGNIAEDDPQMKAYESENYGKCDDFFVTSGRYSRGGIALYGALTFLFPEDEMKKARAAKDIKDQIDYLNNPNSMLYSDGRCSDRENMVHKLEALLNAVIQAGPEIAQEHDRRMASEAAAQNRQQERAAALEEDTRQQALLAEDNARIEEQKKAALEEAMQQCRDSKPYMLFQAAQEVRYNLRIIDEVEAEIAREREVGKVSGFVNATKLNSLGRYLVTLRENTDFLFKIYKENGGAASKSSNVEEMLDPCDK